MAIRFHRLGPVSGSLLSIKGAADVQPTAGRDGGNGLACAKSSIEIRITISGETGAARRVGAHSYVAQPSPSVQHAQWWMLPHCGHDVVWSPI
jgi:hypothetical protein